MIELDNVAASLLAMLDLPSCDIAIKSTSPIVLAALTCAFLRRKSAAMRHRVWGGGLSAAFVVPLTLLLLPPFTLPFLPNTPVSAMLIPVPDLGPNPSLSPTEASFPELTVAILSASYSSQPALESDPFVAKLPDVPQSAPTLDAFPVSVVWKPSVKQLFRVVGIGGGMLGWVTVGPRTAIAALPEPPSAPVVTNPAPNLPAKSDPVIAAANADQVCSVVEVEDQEQKTDDAHAAAPVITFRGHATEVTSLGFSADESQAISMSEKDVRIWDPVTGKEIRRLKVDGESVIGLSRDFGRLAIARSFHFDVPAALRGTMTLRDTANGNDIWNIEPHGDWNRDVPFVPAIASLVFSPDGRRLATAGGVTKVRGHLPKGVVKIWDAETGKELRQLDELSARADAVAFSADGKYLAAGTWGASGEAPISGEVHVWDTTTGQRLHTFKTRPDVEQGGNPGSVMNLAFNPRGTRLAAGVSDGTVRLWELPSGKELFEMRGHQGGTSGPEVDKFTGMMLRGGSVRSVAFSPDGSRLASAGYDRVIRVWDTETGEQAKTYRFDSARINAVAFSPDGQRLAAAGSNAAKSGQAVIWKMSYEKEKLVGPILPTLRKAEMAKADSEVTSQIENAVRSDEMHWQNLDASQRGIKDRIVKVLTKTPTLSDQQVALAVHLLTIGRPPTDEEAKKAQKKFAETKDRLLSVLQHARGLVQSREFSTGLAATNDRLFTIQRDLATKRAAGEIPVLLTAEEFQKLAVDCAASANQAAKTDEQFVDLAYLLALSRFPSTTEANQVVPHLKKAIDRATATRDIFNFLLNSKEFVVPR